MGNHFERRAQLLAAGMRRAEAADKAASVKEPLTDLKAALGNGSKPDITHVRKPLMNYIARACEYGSAKYERANYMRPTGSSREDFIRFGAYLRSAISHFVETADAMELHLSQDPKLEDLEGMRAAMYAADTDVTPGASVGASGLPHVAHGLAGAMMALVQATGAGMLPADPGQPWVSVCESDEGEVHSPPPRPCCAGCGEPIEGTFECFKGGNWHGHCLDLE